MSFATLYFKGQAKYRSKNIMQIFNDLNHSIIRFLVLFNMISTPLIRIISISLSRRNDSIKTIYGKLNFTRKHFQSYNLWLL